MAALAVPAAAGISELASIDMAIEKRCGEDKEFAAQYTANKKRIADFIDHILDIISRGQTSHPKEIGQLLAGRCSVIVETKASEEAPLLILGEIPEVTPLAGVPLMGKMIKLSKAIELAIKTKVFTSGAMSFLPDLKMVACRLISTAEAGDAPFSVILSLS